MKNTFVKTHTDIGVTGLLTVLFIILKLFGAIDWNWLWVLSPLWASDLLILFLGLLLYFVGSNKFRFRLFM